MATFKADQVRAVAIELQNKARALYQTILPIYRETGAWALNGLDPNLPGPYAVKVQLATYRAMQIDTLKLSEWIAALLAADPADTLAYPPPPAIAAGQLVFDIIAFTYITIGG